jgi:hypothetical protein
MPRAVTALGSIAIGLALIGPQPVQGQDWTQREYPLAPPNSNNNFVAPFFDGWYENEDGTYTLSFGFMNRNDSDLIEIPLGEDNFIEPSQYDGMQPTSFPTVMYPGFGGPRERGIFGVVVPADFDGDVWWTLTTDGYTTRVPGRLVSPGPVIKAAYELGITPQARGSLRPIIRFSENGPDGIGIEGLARPGTLSTEVGEPLEVQFWAFDRGERELGAVNMSLWKHRGPVGGMIAFESLVEPAPVESGALRRQGRRPVTPGPIDIGDPVGIPITGATPNIGSFRATFDTPGEYVIRVRIDSFNQRDSAMGNQCCWTNGYVTVNITE